MMPHARATTSQNLLPEEDELDDPDDDDGIDIQLPGDLWFRAGGRARLRSGLGKRRGWTPAASATL